MEEDVFIGQSVAGFIKIILKCFHQNINVVVFIDGHDLISFMIQCCMQRQGKFALQSVIRHFFNNLGNASCTNGDPSGSHIHALIRINKLNTSFDILVGEQWFTHAHVNYIG